MVYVSLVFWQDAAQLVAAGVSAITIPMPGDMIPITDPMWMIIIIAKKQENTLNIMTVREQGVDQEEGEGEVDEGR